MCELEKASLLIHSTGALGRQFQVAMAVHHRFMKSQLTVRCLQWECGEAGGIAKISACPSSLRSPVLRTHAELIEADED